VGAGAVIAAACDVRVFAESARIGFVFPKVGLCGADMGATYLLPRIVGLGHASELLFFGDIIDGERAAQIGLAWAAVDAEEVEPTALVLAEAPGRDPELARRTARSFRTVNGPPALPWGAALDVERSAQMWSMRRKAQSG
jgi:enoyl-CoA hydratase